MLPSVHWTLRESSEAIMDMMNMTIIDDVIDDELMSCVVCIVLLLLLLVVWLLANVSLLLVCMIELKWNGLLLGLGTTAAA